MPGIMIREFFFPVMETFMRGLPFRYKNVLAEYGTVVKVVIDTSIGGQWFLTRNANGWELSSEQPEPADAMVTFQPDIAWKLFTKAINPQSAKKLSNTAGDATLTEPVFRLIAVMA